MFNIPILINQCINMFKAGKDFEIDAFNEVDNKKQIELSRAFVVKIIKDRHPIYKNYNDEQVERSLASNPIEKALFDEAVNNRLKFDFVNHPEHFLYGYEKALEIIKKCQPRCIPGLADDLYNKVAEIMGFEDRDEDDNFLNLKFYTAVGSKLDYSFGIDGFISYTYIDKETDEEKEIIISLDLTLNKYKSNAKADIILTFEEDAADKRSNWSKPVAYYATVIAQKLKERMPKNTKNN